MAITIADPVKLNAICNQILDDLTVTSKSVALGVRWLPKKHQRQRLRQALMLLGGIQRSILEIRSHL